MVKNKFYVTTPIYYPNDIPHIGHAYTTLAADVLSRWQKLRGKEVFFLTGTDENAKKVFQAAEKKGIPIKEFVDKLSQDFKKAWKNLNIEYSRFIRTTDKSHTDEVVKILDKTYKNGDIYKGSYEGYYCIGCEAYYTEKDLIDGCCPIHKTKAELMKEESYFFKLSKYQKKLLELYKKNPEFIRPNSKRNEIINRVKEGLKDLSISRKDYGWGIKVPFDKSHVAYVWYDALTNYYTATREKGKEKFWPADVHIIGKDILWFHTVIWPAMLLSARIKLPKSVFAHGWWTFNNEKISKSRGKVVNVEELVSIAGIDSARYFLFRATPFGEDGDFSEQALVDRHNNELANKLGNLVSRVSTLAETYGLQKAKPLDSKKLAKKVETHFEKYEFDKALNEIFAFIDTLNEYIQTKKPWETHDKRVIYQLANGIKDATILLSPFIPQTCEKIARTFNFEISLNAIKKPLIIKPIKKSEVLFKKIEFVTNPPVSSISLPVNNNKVNKTPCIEGIMTTIDFKDWEKIELRVGKIENVEDIEGADKLYKLTVNIGEETRTVCAGIKKFYKKEDLKDKNCVIFANLAPRMMRGIESQGMLLAAVSADESQVFLLQPEKDIPAGSKVR
jgi:methionyl-tRNA synthetase